MDAKVGDWVVTPRRGKAVEINALWYNALRLVEGWVREEHGDGVADEYAAMAERCRASFNKRFWFAEGNYLYDVVDAESGGDDASFAAQSDLCRFPRPSGAGCDQMADRSRSGEIESC